MRSRYALRKPNALSDARKTNAKVLCESYRSVMSRGRSGEDCASSATEHIQTIIDREPPPPDCSTTAGRPLRRVVLAVAKFDGNALDAWSAAIARQTPA